MGERRGRMVCDDEGGGMYRGRAVRRTGNMAEETMKTVDSEGRKIIDGQYGLARRLIEENRDKVEAMAKALLEWETIDSEQIDDIIGGKPPRPPKSTTSPPPTGGKSASGGAQGAAQPA